MRVRARAPGRVNVIGDHTDYTGGLCLPMAIQLGTTVDAAVGGRTVRLRSDADPAPAEVPLQAGDARTVEPAWARYVAGVVAELAPGDGLTGSVTTDLPLGTGLSSSAALEVAVALALGFDGPPLELARLCQRAEQRAVGVPCGILDQVTSVSGVAGALLLVDCASDEVTPTPLPEDAAVYVVQSGQSRVLAGSAYAERRGQCEQAIERIGPLRDATAADAETLDDPVLRRRARHVVSENARVRSFVAALATGDLAAAGACMFESHRSLADDFEVSTPVLDRLVERLAGVPGVFGARLTGAGFGGAVVALADPEASVPGQRVHPSSGATVERIA